MTSNDATVAARAFDARHARSTRRAIAIAVASLPSHTCVPWGLLGES